MISVTVNNRIPKKTKLIKSAIHNASLKAVKETTDVFYKAAYDNVSFDPHTPSELRKLGYPYKFGEPIKPHGHDPKWGRHTLSGDLREGLTKDVQSIDGRYVLGLIGWLDGYSDIVAYVILGTYKMIPTPILRLTAHQIDVGDIFLNNLTEFKATNA